MDIRLIHFGPGNVGKTLLQQLLDNQEAIEKNFQAKMLITGIVKTDSFEWNSRGLKKAVIQKIISSGLNTFGSKYDSNQVINLIKRSKKPLILIDTTASNSIQEVSLAALKEDAYVVMSNKKPFSSSYSLYKKFMKYKHKVFFETTVGAGLPVITTLQELINTGDEILEIKGCFSGTLGYIASLLQEGKSFSYSVLEAKRQGYTEPDPRDDLSGRDVGRKALILARLVGRKISLSDIEIQPLFPDNLKSLSLEDFLKKVTTLDDEYKRLIAQANKKGNTLKYVAQISRNKIKVGLQEVPLESDIGSLKGPDNMIVIQTKRYHKNPLVIKGPGAGREVTAAGVLGDLLKIIRQVKGKEL